MGDDSEPDALSGFIRERGPTEWSVQVVNRTEPAQVQRMIETAFDGLSIDVSETDRPDLEEDLLLLLRDGAVVHTSPLAALEETLLLVNSDMYRTGTRSIEEVDPPEVLSRLSDTAFDLRGYPASNTEKLVLTVMSRYIEREAWRRGDGSLRASFQRLSRLDDERGTRQVYERLADTAGLDVHVYGVPDREPTDAFGGTVHGVADRAISRHWFVVYRSPGGRGVALLARSDGGNEWEGFWTFDSDEIRAIDQYISRSF